MTVKKNNERLPMLYYLASGMWRWQHEYRLDITLYEKRERLVPVGLICIFICFTTLSCMTYLLDGSWMGEKDVA